MQCDTSDKKSTTHCDGLIVMHLELKKAQKGQSEYMMLLNQEWLRSTATKYKRATSSLEAQHADIKSKNF